MLDQEKIGTFISELRKEKGLTQKQLSEKLNLSDKAISKWETGKSLPDNAIMPELCEVLGITVNELFSGERLPERLYAEKAEENIMGLFKENEEQRVDSKKGKIFGFVGIIVLFLLFLIFVFSLSTGASLSIFLDIPSMLIVFGFMFFVLWMSGSFKEFTRAFSITLGKKQYGRKEMDESLDAVKLAIKAVWFGCLSGSLGAVIVILRNLDDLSILGPTLSVALLSPTYTTILTMILLPVEARLKKLLR